MLRARGLSPGSLARSLEPIKAVSVAWERRRLSAAAVVELAG